MKRNNFWWTNWLLHVLKKWFKAVKLFCSFASCIPLDSFIWGQDQFKILEVNEETESLMKENCQAIEKIVGIANSGLLPTAAYCIDR